MTGMSIADIGSLVSAAGSLASAAGSWFGGDGGASSLNKKMLKLMTAGYDNGIGDGYYYDKKSNTWRNSLSPSGKSLANASRMEELQTLLQDLPMQRHDRLINSTERDKERAIADTLMGRIIDRSPMTAERLEGDLYSAQAEGINDAYDKIINDVATTGLRTGTSANGAISDLAQLLSKDLGSARRDARLQALTGADDINSKRTNDAINQYSAMATRAANGSNIPFQPEQLTTTLLSGANNAAGRAPGAGYTALQAGQSALSQKPDYFSMGQTLSNLLEGFGSMFETTPNKTTVSTGLGNKTYGATKTQRQLYGP